MKKNLLFLVLFSLIFVVVSCKKEKTNPPTDVPYVPVAPVLSTSLSGLGYNSGTPVGTSWAFPANVKVVGHILGGDPGKAAFLDAKTIVNWENYTSNLPKSNWETHGLGMFVNLYMKLYNSSASPTSFIFPAGLLFCNDSTTDTIVTDTCQTGIIVIPDTVNIPGGDTINLCLKSFCTNPSRHSSNSQAIYSPKVVSNNDQVYRFIGALKGKSLMTLTSHESDILSYIWQFTTGAPLSAEDWATIAAW
jgi:hypothetical protein